MVKLDMSANSICAEGGKLLAAALKDNQIMTELNIADNKLGNDGPGVFASTDMSGVIAIGDAIPTMGAMVTVNVMGNNIGKEQALNLVSIFKEKDQMKSIGLASCNLGVDGAKAVADYVSGSAVLTMIECIFRDSNAQAAPCKAHKCGL